MEPTETGLRHRARRVARQISKQHRHLNPLFEVLEDSLSPGGGDGAPEACARFRDALEAHFSLEDEFFFPALHGLCPERAAEAISEGGLEQAARVLQDFASTLSSHERREEQLVASINVLADVAHRAE